MLNSGIYIITCIPNGYIYVGRTKQNFNIRWSQHTSDLKYGKHCSPIFQNCFNKYGLHNFSFDVLERCEGVDLVKREQYWIDLLQPNINISKNATASNALCGRDNPAYRKDIDDKKDQIIEDYLTQGLTFCELSTKYKFDERSFRRRIKKWGIERTKSQLYFLRNPNKQKRGANRKRQYRKLRKEVINVNTKEVFKSLKEAADSCNINYESFKAKLNGNIKNNNTNFIIFNGLSI